MIWSSVAIDYSAGVTRGKNNTAVPNKIGCYVMTIEESKQVMREKQ